MKAPISKIIKQWLRENPNGHELTKKSIEVNRGNQRFIEVNGKRYEIRRLPIAN